MKKGFNRMLSVILTIALLISVCPAQALAAKPAATEAAAQQAAIMLPFTDAGASEETKAAEAFYFGSTNLTVSENSTEDYLLKICRGGKAEGEASVTVKFADYSAVYGENYTVSLYNGDGELTLNPDRFSVVDFLTDNADSYREMTEEEAADEENKLLTEFASQKSANIYDVNGNLISSVQMTENDEEEPSYSMESENLSDGEEFDSNLSDYSTAVQVRLTFAPGETEKYIVITPKYSAEAQGDAQAEITLDNPSEGMQLPSEDFITVLTIQDEDEITPAVLSITDTECSADGDTVTLTVTREGAINQMVGAKLTTTELDAVMGDDFQGVDAMLYFPMGVTKRDITLKLNHRYADKSVQFTVNLSDPVGATLDNASCLVSVLPSSDVELLSDEDAEFKLQSYNSKVEEGQESEALDFTEQGYSLCNKAWLTSNTSFFADNRGSDCPYNTWCGVYYDFSPFYYSGMSVNWSVGRKVPTYGCSQIGYYDHSGNYYTIFSKDTGSFSNDWDSGFFEMPGVKRGFVGIKTTSRCGKYLTVHQVKMTRMKYTVNLMKSDALSYVGVSSAEEESYVTTAISGCAMETRKKELYAGDSITFTTPNTGKNYAVLSDLEVVDSKGNKIADISGIAPDAMVIQNGTSVTLTLTKELMGRLGYSLEYFDCYTKVDGRWEGQLYIKPVFSYQDAIVVFGSTEEGEAYFQGRRYSAWTMHVGDVITLSEQAKTTTKTQDSLILAAVVENPIYHCVGYDAECYKTAEVDAIPEVRPGEQFASGTCSIRLEYPVVYLYPRVSAKDNMVTVRVEKSLVDGGAFDTTQGVFLYPKTESGNYYYYTLNDTSKKLSADVLYSALAVTAKPGTVATWKRGSEELTYSGSVMYLFTGNKAEDNLLTLSAAAVKNTYTVKGALYCDNSVIGGMNKTSVQVPAIGAAVSTGTSSATTDMTTGEFELTDVAAAENTIIPILAYFNNSANILTASIPARGTTINLSATNLSTNNADTAYVKNVFFTLDDVSMSATHALVMNGKKLVMSAEVADGVEYTVTENGKSVTKTERVTGVNFLVLDGRTYEIKSIHEAQKSDDGVWDATILKFNPEVPEEYDAGDLFYVQIITDRAVASFVEGGEGAETAYAPVATAYGIAAGGDYTPQTISFTAPLTANDLMSSSNQEEEAEQTKTTKSFAKLPIIGNMDLLSVFAGTVKIGHIGSDYTYDDDGEYVSSDPTGSSASDPYLSKVSVRISVRTQTLSDGRLRLHIGVVLSAGNNKFNANTNPYDNAVSAYDMLAGAKMQATGIDPKAITVTNDGVLNVNERYYGDEGIRTAGKTQMNAMKTNLSGLQLSFSMSFGLYLDFVVVEEDGDLDGMYFVGVGGYLGFSGNITYIAYFVIPIVYLPAYLGFSATASLTGYAGGVEDLSQYLKSSFTAEEFLGEDEIKVNDYMKLNLDGAFNVSVTGFAGVGVCNVLGIRLNLTLALNVSYVNRMTEWYQNLSDNWGVSANLSVGGQVDLLFTSVPLNGLSVPLAEKGFNEYFAALARGEKMVALVREKATDVDEELASLRDTVIEDLQSRSASTQKLEADVYALYEYLHNHPDKVGLKASAIYMMYYTDSDVYSLLSTESEAQEYEVKQPVSSTWLGDTPMDQAGFSYSETRTFKLLTKGYDNPGTQLIPLDNGKVIAFFLADPSTIGNPDWSGENQTTVLMYSIFNGRTWSKPAAVEKSATNDYYPNVVKCGSGKLMVSWVSTPDADAVDIDDPTKEEVVDLYSSMEVFSTMYDVENDRFTAIEQLTDDEYMDIYPQGVYDSATGDCAVYYIKTAPDDEIPVGELNLTEFFNLYSDTVYSMICYRLYDAASGKWVVDYYPEEIADGYTQEDYAEEQGQRYLPSVLEVLKQEGVVDEDDYAALYTYEVFEDGETVTKSSYIDPPINDLVVCEAYNGLTIYAYTVDMDQNLSTNADTELYIQVYDFLSHKTYRPIRVTNDEYSQARPKLVRGKDNTYLFWLANDSVIEYMDVSELIRDYVDADGRIVSTYYQDADGKIYYQDSKGIYKLSGSSRVYADETVKICRKDQDGWYYMSGAQRVSVSEEALEAFDGLIEYSYEPVPSVVNSTVATDSLQSTVSDYQVVLDNDNNIYILWTQLVTDENETDPYAVPANEVFASAMVRAGDEVTSGWSDPYQLTKSGKQIDGVCGAVDANGKLMLAYNCFDMEYIGDTEEFLRTATLNEDGTLSGNPYSISDTDLVVTFLNDCGCMKATSIEISDTTPVAGETVSVTAVIENAGLTTAKQGYRAEFYELRGEKRGELVAQFAETNAISANDSRTVTFEWTVPEDYEDVQLLAVVKETGYINENTFKSEALQSVPEYTLCVQEVVQQEEGFAATYTITNAGNAASKEGDRIELRFRGLYQSYEKYGLDTDLLKSEELETLQPGESRTVTTSFTVPMVAFDFIGYDQLDVVVLDQDGGFYAGSSGDLVLRNPVSMKVNNNAAVNIAVGTEKQMNVDLGNRWLSRLNYVLFSVADESVATVDEEGKLTAVSAGQTTLTAVAMPSGKEASVTVVVRGEGEEPFTDVKAGSYCHDAVLWAVDRGITSGMTPTTFVPNAACTRAQMVTFLWRAAGCPEPTAKTTPFADVNLKSFYGKAVLWAVETGITKGVDATHFAPDATVSRAQAVTFVYRLAGSPKTSYNAGFSDVKAGAYYTDAVNWAAEKKIVVGIGANRFATDTACTRGQIVTILYRYLNR